jgi:UDP-glucose 4-epimerase
VNAHLKALGYLRRGGESLVANCGFGKGYSVHEVLQAVMRASGRRFDVHYRAKRPGDAASVVANSALVRRILNWTPRYDDLETIIQTALAWEQSLSDLSMENPRALRQRIASAAF